MQIDYDSVQFHILERLCLMPKAVRGMASAMVLRSFGSLDAVEDLALAGLMKKRGWADGPGWIWVPTEAGEALYHSMTAAAYQSLALKGTDRVILPKDQRSS